jgi:hypothetical protein
MILLPPIPEFKEQNEEITINLPKREIPPLDS